MQENSNCWYSEVCSMFDTDCEKGCARFLEMSYLMDSSRLPKKRQRPQVLSACDEDLDAYLELNDIKGRIVDFVNNGESLYITSNGTGNGKTSWAIKLMLKYFDSVWYGNGFRPRAVFIHVPTFLLKCKDFNSKDSDFEELKRLIPTVDLVVWDDIASTSISTYDYSQLLMYLDCRALNDLSNIFTGNLVSREVLTKALGAKLSSRMWANDTTVIEFKGGDRR